MTTERLSLPPRTRVTKRGLLVLMALSALLGFYTLSPAWAHTTPKCVTIPLHADRVARSDAYQVGRWAQDLPNDSPTQLTQAQRVIAGDAQAVRSLLLTEPSPCPTT